MALSTIDWINQATSKYISKMVEQIFQQDPIMRWLHGIAFQEEEPDEFDEFVKAARAEYGRSLWDPED